MLMSALYELLADKEAFRERMEKLALPGVSYEFGTLAKCGITGTHINVIVHGDAERSYDVDDRCAQHPADKALSLPEAAEPVRNGASHGLARHSNHKHDCDDCDNYDGDDNHKQDADNHHHHSEIIGLIKGLGLTDEVCENAIGVYNILGDAESKVHGVPVDNIHLHEVGSLDAIADIVGCCILIGMLGVTEITASPVHVGYGFVRCRHGILPIPAPATAEILKGVPVYAGSIKGELCTPTGAALLKQFVKSFSPMPPMTVQKIGYGMGSKDFQAANCVRAYLYNDSTDGLSAHHAVSEISCNLDDMTPEAIGAVFEVLLDNGALDVYAAPITMKKSRPAVKLSCLCSDHLRDKIARLMLLHTTTLGIRISSHERVVLDRSARTVKTDYGDILIKQAGGFGIAKLKPEFEDVLASAKAHGVPFAKAYDAAIEAASRKC